MEYISEIIIGVLAFAGTLCGSMLTNNKNLAVMREQIKGVKEDINGLSTRVDKHNNLVERMVVVEQRSKSNTHRLDKIEMRGDIE